MAESLIPVFCKCSKCGGTGRAPLRARLARTLAAMRGMDDITMQSLYRAVKEPDIGPTAIARRLEELMRLGLVTRRRVGDIWVYKPVDT